MPPENSGYMIAAYVVTAVILGGYAVSLWMRARKAIKKSVNGER
jgi:hypothetical protein